MDNTGDNVEELIRDYVGHLLRRKGIVIDEYAPIPSSNPFVRKLKYSIRLLCDEFQDTYCEVFDEICNEIEITPAKAHDSFFAVVDELFEDGVKWGRLVALFALAGSLSHLCVSKGTTHLVEYIIEWTKSYFMGNLINWIDIHNGWDGLIHFAEMSARNKEAQIWPHLKHVLCGVAASALGIFTLKAFLTSKS